MRSGERPQVNGVGALCAHVIANQAHVRHICEEAGCHGRNAFGAAPRFSTVDRDEALATEEGCDRLRSPTVPAVSVSFRERMQLIDSDAHVRASRASAYGLRYRTFGILTILP